MFKTINHRGLCLQWKTNDGKSEQRKDKEIDYRYNNDNYCGSAGNNHL